MSHAIRNTIVLAVIFIIISGIGYYWLNVHKGDILNLLVVRSERTQQDYSQLKQLADLYEVMKDSLEVMSEDYYNKDKILPTEEDSKVSFEYFNTLASSPGSYLNFTFMSETNQESKEYFTTNYVLAGEALFYNLYNFIWKLENYRRLYKINSLNLQEIQKSDSPDEMPKSYLTFNMMVVGYSSKEKIIESGEIMDAKSILPVNSNPFRPLVRDRLPPNTDNLPDVNNAELQGLTDDRAFIVGSGGKLMVMQVGDKVYLGFLSEINKAENKVVFTLNKGGFKEVVELKLKDSK